MTIVGQPITISSGGATADQKEAWEVQPSAGPERAFGQVLRQFRKKRDVAQDELAFQCGFDRTYISLLERGIRSPTLRTMIKLCRELRVRPSVLMLEVEKVLEGKPSGEGQG